MGQAAVVGLGIPRAIQILEGACTNPEHARHLIGGADLGKALDQSRQGRNGVQQGLLVGLVVTLVDAHPELKLRALVLEVSQFEGELALTLGTEAELAGLGDLEAGRLDRARDFCQGGTVHQSIRPLIGDGCAIKGAGKKRSQDHEGSGALHFSQPSRLRA